MIGFRLYVSNSEEAARADLKVVNKKGQQAPTQKAFNMLADALVLAEGIEDCCKFMFQPLDQFIERDDDKNITFSPHHKAKACEPHKSPAVLREAWLRLQVLVLHDSVFLSGGAQAAAIYEVVWLTGFSDNHFEGAAGEGAEGLIKCALVLTKLAEQERQSCRTRRWTIGDLEL